MRTSRIALFAICLLALLAVPCFAAAPEITIKCGHNSPPNEDQAIPWQAFKEFVERESQGRISVPVYGGAAMGGCLESAEKVQMNILQMHFGSSSNLTALFPELEVFELPYLVTNVLDNVKLFYNADGTRLEGPVFEQLDKAFRAKGMKITWISPATFRAIGMNVPNVRTPADLKGKKIRSTASRLERAVLSDFGANPVSMSFSEVYTALQLKTVDGIGLGAAAMYTNKFHEILKSVLMNKYNTFFMFASINQKFYDQLPPWAKDIVDRGIVHATQTANAQWDALNSEHIRQLAASGVAVYTPTEAEWVEWRKLTDKTSAEYAKRFDPAWVNLVKAQLAK